MSIKIFILNPNSRPDLESVIQENTCFNTTNSEFYQSHDLQKAPEEFRTVRPHIAVYAADDICDNFTAVLNQIFESDSGVIRCRIVSNSEISQPGHSDHLQSRCHMTLYLHGAIQEPVSSENAANSEKIKHVREQIEFRIDQMIRQHSDHAGLCDERAESFSAEQGIKELSCALNQPHAPAENRDLPSSEYSEDEPAASDREEESSEVLRFKTEECGTEGFYSISDKNQSSEVPNRHQDCSLQNEASDSVKSRSDVLAADSGGVIRIDISDPTGLPDPE